MSLTGFIDEKVRRASTSIDICLNHLNVKLGFNRLNDQNPKGNLNA
jgi:hypothetical protein